MTFKSRIALVVLAVVAQFLMLGNVHGQETRSSEETVDDVVVGPEQGGMSLVSLSPWVVDGEVIGAVAGYVYEDRKSERPADYWEVYDKEGNLLAVSWFDKQGIRKTAVDRGIAEEKDELEGVFVLIIEGEVT
jgi:hypothetical protein